MKYTEGERSLFIDSEVLAPGKGIAIASKSIKEWDPPYRTSPLSPEKKDEIISRIKSAMKFKNEPLEIL
jgi:hypothetical protein